MARLVQDESGQIFQDQGGGILEPISAEQADIMSRYDNPLAQGAQAANQGLKNFASGLLGLGNEEYKQQAIEGGKLSDALALENPLNRGAQYLPQVVGGLMSAGAGVAPTAAAEGLIGAATTPENPLMGAAVGAGLGVAGEFAGPVLGAAWGKGKQLAGNLPGFKGGASLPGDALPPGYMRPGAAVVDDLEQVVAPGAAGAPSPPTASPAPIPQGPQQRVVDRVLHTIDNTERAGQQVASTRVMGDMMTPDELAQYGIPVNPGQRALLEATTGDPGSAARARAMMADEEARRSLPIAGRQINDTIAAQQEAATNFVAGQLDVPPGVALTDGTLSEVMAGIGLRLDDIATEMGGVPITKEIRDELAETMRLSSGRHTSRLQQAIDDVLKKADNNGGVLGGQDWMTMRTELNKHIDKGIKDGKIDWVNEANDVMQTFTKAMESKLPSETAAELRKLRKQYAIGATLAKPGARNVADGLVNPVSFYSNWKRPQSMKQRGKDDVGRFMNTMVSLTQKRLPDSGTATRMMQMGENAVGSIPVVGPIVRGLVGGQ